MHVDRVKNRNGAITVLVRESYRDDGKVKKRTLANITHLPTAIQRSVERQLKGEASVSPSEVFSVTASKPHGHVQAVHAAMKALGFERLVSASRCRERALVLAMVAARIIEPASKLATSRSWSATSLATTFGVDGATEDELYRAMDWLLEQQPRIQRKLAKRHLEPCGLVLYDLTSSYVEGSQCPLATRGYSRDGRKDKLQVTYGVLADERGRPVALDAYEGRTADPTTVRDQMVKLKDDFGLDLVVLVGDRGMLAQTVIDELAQDGGFEWISALKSNGIRKLHAEGSLQMGLFDQRNLFELTSHEFPGERLVACRNEQLGKRRSAKRQEMLEATRTELNRVKEMVAKGRLREAGQIGVRVGRVLNKYKMAKHFKIEIQDGKLTYRTDYESIRREAALDGVYVVRTSIPSEAIAAEDVVRHYKRLTRLERVFRSMKSDLKVRPIFHRSEPRVRAHLFLCMLAEYVQWHMREAWRTLLFAQETDMVDERDPVKPAEPTPEAKAKKATKKTNGGETVHSFQTLMRDLSAVARTTHETPNGEFFHTISRPTVGQARALELLAQCGQI